MLFNSQQFFIFFPAVTILYFLVPHRYRWLLLLLASCYFYLAFIPAYILILFFTISVDYFAGIAIENATGQRRSLFLICSLIANIAILAVFKYFNFLNANLASVAALIHWNYPVRDLGLLLPIGLSFHTFQSMSYTIEVYRGRQKAERHPGIFALYVMFYPQLVAGPIERPQHLLPQLRERHEFDDQRVADGLKLMLWGLFKKVVIADRLALMVDRVYGSPANYTGPAFVLATVLFAYQIYCDFSGYSDIAIGAAQVMGFRLVLNFNRPYFSKSVSEFWHRWHISLSMWFRDYLYIPLGGNRVPKWRWQFNLFVTFLISGLWHGPNWTFVLWGALHGFYLLVSLWSAGLRSSLVKAVGLDQRPNLHRLLSVVTTFALVCFAWIFFRAASIGDAFYIVSHLFTGYRSLLSLSALGTLVRSISPQASEFYGAIAAIVLMEGIHLLQRQGSLRRCIAAQPMLLRWLVYYGLIFAVLIFGVFNDTKFIYFQF